MCEMQIVFITALWSVLKYCEVSIMFVWHLTIRSSSDIYMWSSTLRVPSWLLHVKASGSEFAMQCRLLLSSKSMISVLVWWLGSSLKSPATILSLPGDVYICDLMRLTIFPLVLLSDASAFA